jgi:hypothetical protein
VKAGDAFGHEESGRDRVRITRSRRRMSAERQICAVPQEWLQRDWSRMRVADGPSLERTEVVSRDEERAPGRVPEGPARRALLRFGLVVAGVRHEEVGNYTGL